MFSCKFSRMLLITLPLVSLLLAADRGEEGAISLPSSHVKATIPLDSQARYEEALSSSPEAFENGNLIKPKELSSHSLYLLISAYGDNHEKSREILKQVIFYKCCDKIHKKKIGPFVLGRKTTLKDYIAEKKENSELFKRLEAQINALFPGFEEQRKKECQAFETYQAKSAALLPVLAQKEEQLAKMPPLSENSRINDFRKRRNLAREIVSLRQELIKAQEDLEKKVHAGRLPLTKIELFKKCVSDKLTLMFISKIAIGSGAAQRNPDWVNRSLSIGRAGAGVGLSFAGPGAPAAIGVNLITGLGEAGYNVYQKRRIIKYTRRFLGEGGETQKVVALCEFIVPATIDRLAERYDNPLKLYETDAKHIENLAEYATKLMIKSSWRQPNRTLDSQKEIADFLCDGISYYKQEAGKVSAIPRKYINKLSGSKQRFHHILTDSGVVTETSPHIFYARKEKHRPSHIEEDFKYGFRKEDKDPNVWAGYGLSKLPDTLKDKAENLLSAGNAMESKEFTTIKEDQSRSQEKRVVKEFFKENIEVILDELPGITDTILRGIKG